MNKIAVNIISGFLGSGKTTAIIELFKKKPKDEKWAILINEFGKQSIDGITLNQKTTANEILEIHGGCICCTSAAYFEEALETLSVNQEIDRLLIEPTGLGGLESVSDAVKSNSAFNLNPIICLVESGVHTNKLQIINGIFLDQIRNSDLLVVSICDLNSETSEETLKWLKNTFSQKSGYYTSYNGEFDETILKMKFKARTEKGFSFHSIQYDITEPNDFCTSNLSFGKSQYLNLDKLKKALTSYIQLQRIKGYVLTDNGWYFVNYSSGVPQMESCGVQSVESELVFIYKRASVDEKLLTKAFKDCVIM